MQKVLVANFFSSKILDILIQKGQIFANLVCIKTLATYQFCSKIIKDKKGLKTLTFKFP